MSGQAYQRVMAPAIGLQTEDTGTYTYLGEAEPGVLTSEASWRISRVTNATNVILFAGSGGFTQIWDNRASLTYA